MILFRPGVVVITDEDLVTGELAGNAGGRLARERDGYVSVSMAEFASAFRSARAANRQTDSPRDPVEDADLVTNRQLAELLGCHIRTAARRAEKYGHKIGGRWFTSAQVAHDLLLNEGNPR